MWHGKETTKDSILTAMQTELEHKLGVAFRHPHLLEQARTHCSWVNEHRGQGLISNERLEFLGDSVLGVVVSQWLFESFPDVEEGELSRLRAQIVEAPACASYAKDLGLEPFLLLGKGEKRNIGRGRDSVLADFFEAVVGALFLDGGFEAARNFLLGPCLPLLEARQGSPETNYKALLQDLVQRKTQQTPQYITLTEEGPPHARRFVVSVEVDGQGLAQGEGSSKREAQQQAAKHALSIFTP
jgi:ribonuclease-3